MNDIPQQPFSTDTRDKPPPADRRGTPLWRQLLVSLVVVVVAVYAWALFFPGAPAMLARSGVALPFVAAAAAEQTAQQGQQGQQTQQAQQGQQANPRGNNPNFQRGQGRQAPLVVTAAVTSAVINDRLTAIGEGSAAQSVTLTAPASGTLNALKVAPGDHVETGAVIAELDSDTETIAAERAKLAADNATAALTRATTLANSHSIAGVDLTAAQLAADQANLEVRNAELSLSTRTIAAPIAGTVGLLQVTPGNVVTPQTVLTTIEDSSEILINFWVPERYAASIAVGMPVTAEAVALPGQSFTGTVSAVDNRIDQASRTLQVQAELPNADGRMRPGMSFAITMGFPGDAFAAVDPLAIQWAAEGAYVWKYADGKVQQAFVKIAERNSGGVLVTGDIAVGDQVVTQGVLQLQQGMEVRLLDDATGAPEGKQRGQGEPGQQTGQGQQTGTPL